MTFRFDGIAPVYDLANRVFSLGLDRSWRRSAVRRLGLEAGQAVLDVCGGTGDLAFLAAAAVGAAGRSVVLDVSRPMLLEGRARRGRALRGRRGGPKRAAEAVVRWVQGDAERLPFPDGRFDTVTAGFGVRNLARLEEGFREMHRVLRPGGRALILEFSIPRQPLFRRLYDVYSRLVMPLEARLLYGTAAPVRYLASSIRAFAPPDEVAALLRETGFEVDPLRSYALGIATGYFARKR